MKFVIITFVTLVASYFLGIQGELIGDDLFRILDNSELNSLKDSLTGGLADRPLLMFFMWLEKSLFGIHYTAYRIANLLFLTLAAQQLYLLLKDILEEDKETDFGIAFFAALLFAIHPLHSQSITVIIQGGVIIAGFLGMMSMRYFFKYVKTSDNRYAYFSMLVLFTAFFSKPIVSFLPIFFVLYAFKIQKKSLRDRLILLPYFLGFFIPVAYYLYGQKNVQVQSISPLNYFLTQTEVVFTYVKLMILPLGLRYLHDFQFISDVFNNYRWFTLAAHFVIIFSCWKILKNKIHFLFFIGFYLSFLPESGFFAIDYFAFEHRTFFPLGFLIIIVSLLWKEHESKLRNLSKVLVSILIILYLGLNQVRNLQINSNDNWMLHTLKTSQNYHHYNFNFTYLLLQHGKWRELTPIIKKYRKLYPKVARYQILSQIYEYYAHPEKSNQVLTNIGYFLPLPFEGNEVRRRKEVNRFMLGVLGKESRTLENMIFIENMMAQQLKTFHAKPTEYGEYIKFYYDSAKELLSDKYRTAYAAENPESYLKSRAILVFYYKEKDTNLKNEIVSSLKKHPDSQVLTRLNEMIE